MDHLTQLTDGGGTPLILIHGFFETSTVWSGVVQRNLHVLPSTWALPLPGHPPWVDTISDLSGQDWIERCIFSIRENIGPRVRIVGHSTGGLLGLKICQFAPELVEDVFLIGALHDREGIEKSVCRAIARHPVFGRWAIWLGLRAWLATDLSFNAGLASVANSLPNDIDLADMRQEMLRADPAALNALLRWIDCTTKQELISVASPITAMIGSHDPVIASVYQLELLRIVPQAHAQIVNTGHIPFIENPDAFDHLFQAWLAGGHYPSVSVEAKNMACEIAERT